MQNSATIRQPSPPLITDTEPPHFHTTLLPSIPASVVSNLATESVIWSSQNGLVMSLPAPSTPTTTTTTTTSTSSASSSTRTGSIASGSGVQPRIVHAPVSLLPTPFDARRFRAVESLAPLFNELMARISFNHVHLASTLRDAAEADEFTGKLLQMMEQVDQERAAYYCNKRNETVPTGGAGGGGGGDGAASTLLIQDPVTLLLTRSDYMLDQPTNNILQVEINMIAASFGCLSTLVTRLHRYTLKKTGVANHEQIAANEAMDRLAEGLATAHEEMMATALYRRLVRGEEETTRNGGMRPASPPPPSPPVVLFVVQPNERNAFDQQWLATRLYDAYGIKVIRKTLHEISLEAELLDEEGRVVTTEATTTTTSTTTSTSSSSSSVPFTASTILTATQASSGRALRINQHLVTVAYLRAGYAPTDYPTASEWMGRRIMERSVIVKCPDLGQQLAGAKKIQQDLTRQGVVERFLPPKACSEEQVEALRRCFAGQWALEHWTTDLDVQAAMQKAYNEASDFVLKPQREGGGNNFYDDELRAWLAPAVEAIALGGDAAKIAATARRLAPPQHDVHALASYILMEKIRPPTNRTIFLRDGSYFEGESLSELGIYGVYVKRNGLVDGDSAMTTPPSLSSHGQGSSGDGVLVNCAGGYLLRTKLASSNEGGVAAGYAVLDSVYLTD